MQHIIIKTLLSKRITYEIIKIHTTCGEPYMFPNEAQTRKKLIDGQITKAGWNLYDRDQVRFEVPASGDDDNWTDGITDYSLCESRVEI